MSAPADPVPDVWPPRLPHLLGQDGVRNLHGQDPVPPGHMDLRGSAQVKKNTHPPLHCIYSTGLFSSIDYPRNGRRKKTDFWCF